MLSFHTHLVRAGMNTRCAGQVNALLVLWMKSCGPEWFIKRVKSIKQYYLKRLAGDSQEITWLALNEDGIPKGPIKHIFKLKKPRKILDSLLVYSHIILKNVSAEQDKKFFSSVSAKPTPIPFIPFLKEAVLETPFEWFKYTYQDYPYTGTKRVPFKGGSNTNSIYTLGKEIHLSMVRKMTWDNPEVVQDFFQDISAPYLGTEYFDEISYDYVGRISCLQERGGKARFIANPLLTLQCLSFPLGRNMFSHLKKLSWDCTFDQEKGVRWAQKKLSEGKKMFSIDLSDATNHFPLELILRVLKWLPVPESHRRYFSNLSQEAWDARNFGRRREVYFLKGQPLGLYPSFPCFAFAHGCLIRCIEMRYNLSDTFRILGDDVIISNPLIQNIYRRILAKLGCPVSESKTITGSVGEFAGYIITSNSYFRPQKAPKSSHHSNAFLIPTPDDCTNPYDLWTYVVYNLGSKNISGLPLKARAVLSWVFGVISLDDPLRIPNGPDPWNTITRLSKIFPDITWDNLKPSDSRFKTRAHLSKWFSDLLKEKHISMMFDYPNRMSWYKSLISDLPVYMRLRSPEVKVSYILKRAFDREVWLKSLPDDVRSRLLVILQGEFLAVVS